ncbi:MAG: hypothetical protein M1820_007462 [Bogoriella megaspora]|nr:MAG: hypothetical protein M1820_007462 [Bogoriella megaspora]
MLTPTYVNLRYFFYPIGNTPAVNLLRDVPCQSESGINLLLLASGDVRNILFTLRSIGSPALSTALHFTVCDFEPAVLARNVLLLSLITREGSETSPGQLWCLYYHLFVTDNVLRLIQDQACELANASGSLDTWAASRYGKVFRFTNEASLARVRALWTQYLDTRNMSLVEVKQYETTTRSVINTIATIQSKQKTLQGYRSTGLHSTHRLEDMSNACEAYWKTGVAAGNTYDAQELKICGGGHANPLFVFSSSPTGEFAVHYSTDPLTGFNLAEAFDGLRSEKVSPNVLADTAKSQFRSCCEVFAHYVRSGKASLLIHCGDAINFCYEIQKGSPDGCPLPEWTHLYAQPWSAETSRLSCTHPITYDIIDTSNLTDHVGILNILPAAAPLLTEHPFSVLYTESLLLVAENTSQTLQTLLSADVTVASLLLGVAPVGHLLGITTDHTGAEVVMQHVVSEDRKTGQRQSRSRVPWRNARSGDSVAMSHSSGASNWGRQRIHMEPGELAKCLMQWYLSIFSSAEDLSKRFETIMRAFTAPLSGDLAYYSRVTIVALLTLAKRNIMTEWNVCMDGLVDKIVQDTTLLVGPNSLQELFLHLHATGIWKSPEFDKDPRTITNEFGPPRDSRKEEGILGRENVPGYLHVALVVPRSKLRIFTDASPNRIGTPGLHLSVDNYAAGFENSFFGVDAFFGSLHETEREDCCEIEADPKGWQGKANLIVTCMMPSRPFLVGTHSSTRVSLRVNTTPSTTMTFTVKLGPEHIIYGANLEDNNHLKLLRQAPEIRPTSKNAELAPGSTPSHHAADAIHSESMPNVSVRADGRISITVRTPIVTTHNGEALSPSAPVHVSQGSPCCMTVNVDGHAQTVRFPFPIDSQNCGKKLARTSLWIELTVLTSLAREPGGYSMNLFPVVQQADRLLSWGLSRVNLDQQPTLRAVPDPELLNLHLGMMLSQVERQMQSGVKPRTTLLDLKETVSAMFSGAAGARRDDEFRGTLIKIFRLQVKKDCSTLLFVNALRHDRDSNSIVLDAFLVPLTLDRISNLAASGAMDKLSALGPQSSIELSDGEEELWKQAWPAFVERCRFKWSHRPGCEYGLPAKIPLSLAHDESPICTCGEGQEGESIPAEAIPFAKYATRVAISPICAIPYVEPTIPGPRISRGPQTSPTQQHPGSVGSTPAADVCGNCGTSKPDLRACAGCKVVKYCNRGCQRADYKEHKNVCGK